ncbi:hypothetical protein HC174_11970 [Salinimicrobium sp. CDJ15-81-2]|nr:hypothetical protein [Salinimicrobium nanhaiense]
MDKREQITEKRNKIVEGLEKSYQKLVEFKRYKKSPLIVARNGEIQEIAHEKILPTTTYIKNSGESVKIKSKV